MRIKARTGNPTITVLQCGLFPPVRNNVPGTERDYTFTVIVGLSTNSHLPYGVSRPVHQEVLIVIWIHRTKHVALRAEQMFVSEEILVCHTKPDVPRYRPTRNIRLSRTDMPKRDQSDRPDEMIEWRRKR